MPAYKVRRFLGLLVTVGTVPLLSGCPESALDITESPSDASQDFAVASSYSEPEGSFSLGEFAVLFDTTVADAFARSVPGNDPFYLSAARGDPADGTAYGPGWNFSGADRNAATDPRLPVLTENDAALHPDWGFVIGDPAEIGAPDHNPYTEDVITGLQPNATYVVGFARLGTNVNGALDQGQAALGQEIDQPDQLVYVGGAPAGDPSVEMVYPTWIPFQADANPYVLGYFSTDASGEGAFDVIIDNSGGDLYTTDSGDPSDADFDKSLVARNDDTPTMFPRYNYLIIFEGPANDAADAADNPQAMRIQLGQDFLASSGAMINNAYAPFPEQIPADELPGVPGFLGARPVSMQATFGHLEALGGGAVYEAWLANPVTGSTIRATGTYYRIQLVPIVDEVTGEVIGFEEDTVETVPDTNRFVGRDDEFRHALAVSDATLGGGPADSVGFHNYLFLTIAESPGGAEPAEARPFWLQYTDQSGTPDDFSDDVFFLSGATRFGTFDLVNPSASRRYSGEGNGLGGVRLDPSGSVMSVEMRNLSRPPVGYELVGWLQRADGTTFRLPEVTGPPPDYVSLVDADVELVEGLVTANGVLDANFRVVTSEAGIDLTEFRRFLITLEPKVGLADRGPILVQVGELPEKVYRPPDTSE